MKTKIVVADDEPRIRKMIARLLTDEGYDVMPVENGREAVEALLSFQPDVILLDQQMPVLTGVEALEEIRRISPTQVVLFVTAFGSISLAVDAVKKGAYDFIEKPFDNDKLLLTVKRAVEHSRMKGEISTLKKTLGEKRSNVIGENTGLKQVMAQVLRVAETNATVLIHGESGTGKELIARAVHHNSLRANGPFVAINCGAIPLTLMESELFGHERGAFTDAKEAKAGTFERANGGTLFLDEVGELPLDAQVKLLRVLEERKITRIGGKKAILVDVRIVAATNRNLDDEVKGGHFRLDLLYRLNVFTLILPPLRERKEDIPLLANFFIRKYNQALSLDVQSITPEAVKLLSSYDWPGNVRDLENALQSAMILCTDGTIRPEHLPDRVKGYDSTEEATIAGSGGSIREINAQMEKELILEALKKHNFNRTLTAEALAISRKTLFNKMKRYGLSTDEI
ncbi:sigma-54-dependent transcriptional regulator [Parabacteroides goldsteinii]|jgi:two-component system response regulator|uniref:sigma-54-dependent transcriptional regulator n=3 Tax=Parabacteroides goldsteinii TaxID=328812 RepID=UPI000E9E697E|nr:sigma-54 dependent transcriptional regulator [Parabacteroides goldsteinii]HBA29728.1 sigma-54-dependent Fis family transcriptional regulator [Parabacteroides goldsteinii]